MKLSVILSLLMLVGAMAARAEAPPCPFHNQNAIGDNTNPVKASASTAVQTVQAVK